VKRIFWKILPYFVSICAGFLFYGLTPFVNENLKSLFIHLSAVFFAVSLMFLFYEVIKNLSHKKLNQEIFDYVKMQIDKEVLSIVNQLSKMVYSYKERDHSLGGISKFLLMNKEDIKNLVSTNEYLGFQIYKSWDMSEKGFHELLKNSFMVKRLEDSHVICIISIIKSLRAIEAMQKWQDLYVMTETRATNYKTVSGRELSSYNVEFPDRLLLLKDIGDGKSIVEDFGDFPLYQKDKLLNAFTVNKSAVEPYSEIISEIISDINSWLEKTGSEVLVDTKTFRLVISKRSFSREAAGFSGHQP
jgi:hypothetical protein